MEIRVKGFSFTFTTLLLALFAAQLSGCDGIGPNHNASDAELRKAMEHVLPHSISIHPFTGTRTFDEKGGIRGIDVRIEVSDAYGDPTKAFGDFRFEMFAFVPDSPNPRGQRIAMWEESLRQDDKNILHWDKITHTYQFKLRWDNPITVGKKFVMTATYSSPYTPRLFDEHVFIAGQ